MIIDKEFKYSVLKNYVLKEVQAILEPEGFKLVKSEYSFKKKFQSAALEVAFGFVDYFPDSYEFHFVIIVKIKELEKYAKEFFAFANIDFPLMHNFLIWEGDFNKELQDQEMKFRSGYYNTVHSINDLKVAVSKSLNTITHEALPLAYSLCTVQSFHEYYLNNKDQIIKNFASNDLFISVLLAAFLKGRSEFESLAGYLKQRLDIEKSRGINWSQLYFYLGKLQEFVEHHQNSIKTNSSL